MLPGRGYGHDRPLLRLAARLLAADGWQVRAVSWDLPPGTGPADAVRAVLALGSAPLDSGSADPLWDGIAARGLAAAVLDLPEADHLLAVPGDAVRTGQALGAVEAAVTRWLAALRA